MRFFLLIFALAGTPAFGGLITNGTFDSNCANWNFGGFSNFCDTTGGNLGGALVLNDGPGPVPIATQSVGGLALGSFYQISLDAKTFYNCCNDGVIFGAGVEIDGQQFEFLVLNNQPWTTYTFNFTYGGGSNILVLSAQRNGTDSDAEFDNVDVNAVGGTVPEPGSLALLAGGMVALCALRRRK